MKSRKTRITGANLVLSDKVMRGSVLFDKNGIEAIIPEGTEMSLFKGFNAEECLEVKADHMYVLPGMIDIHSDAIEREIEPRPQTFFPIDFSLAELEKKVISSGITSIFHSVSLSGRKALGVRGGDMVEEIIAFIIRKNASRSILRNLVHLRYEVTNLDGVSLVMELLDKNCVHMISFMDHTPGQGQYAQAGTYEQYVMKTYGYSMEKIRKITEQAKVRQSQVNPEALAKIGKKAIGMGVRIASHDDDTPEKLDTMLKFGISISEFPTNIRIARYAMSKGVHVAVGAPNVVRNASHSNNLKAIEAIKENAADILCSDYHPHSMMSAVFKLTSLGLNLADVVRMVSLNPAKAAGLEKSYGSIEVGKQADLVVVEPNCDNPFVRRVFIGGIPVFQADFRQIDREGI